MLQSLRTRLERDEEGFTLIELMVVVLIIAILLAIAIPTFLGARNRANDRAAQSSLRNALTAAKTIFTDTQDYAGATNGALQANEPSLTFNTSASGSTDPKQVSVNAGTSPSSVWYGAGWSKSGECFFIKDDSSSGGSGTTYAKTAVTAANAGTACTGTAAATASYTGW